MTERLDLEQQCPQCGAPVVLEETDRLLACPFCRVRLLIHYRRAPRCVLTAAQPDPAEADRLYLPYWRFRGMAFAVGLDQVQGRVLDQSVRAANGPLFPESLGLRPQAMRLKALRPETPGRFFPAELKRKDLLSALSRSFDQRLTNGAAKPFHQAFVGETVQLIYAPYRLERDRLVDGLTGAVLAEELHPDQRPDPATALPVAQAAGEWPQFFATLCPHCGWDLEGERDALVLVCRHCDRAWQAADQGFQPLALKAFRPDSEADLWLPFWLIEAAAKDLALASYGDFIRLTNQSRVPAEALAERPFRFWIPASKLNPPRFLHLGAWLTLEQPEPEPLAKLPRTPLQPINLAPVEGFQSVLALLAQLTVAKKKLLPRLLGARLAFQGYQLVFVPFRRQGVEWIQPQLGFALPVNALHWGRRL